jgi:hypothetical protein
MKKVKLNVIKEEKIDNRVNNTGRPVNKKSARQIRLAKQALYAKLNKQFVSGKKFKINNSDTEYVYNVSDDNKGYISGITGHVCNIDYVGRTKVTGYTFVLNKRVLVEINLKQVKFV